MANEAARPIVLAGMRILVVEDEMLLALALEDLLERKKCSVHKAPSVAGALAQIADNPLDFAFLDINLGGEQVYPVADELQRRGVPFAFMTGYSSTAIEEAWRGRPLLSKPFDEKALEAVVAQASAA
ncbi:MAG TPA: response regulator [Gammaproteobacteria bacterium]|nr:response regulator [Gammaproteobacteria bacterium]